MIEAGSREYKEISFALALGSFLVFCNLYFFQPLLPMLSEYYQVSALQVNWVLAAGTFALALSLVPWAILSEIIGRVRVMQISLVMIPVLGLGYLMADSFAVIVVLRAMMGIVLAGFAAVAVAYMAEEFSPKALSLAVGVYISANSLGGISGRIAGGALTEYVGLDLALIILAAVSAAGGWYVITALPKQSQFTPKKVSVMTHLLSAINHCRNRTLSLAMVIGGLNFALFVNLYSVVGFRLSEAPFSLPVSLASMIFLCYLCGTYTSTLSGKWVNRYSAESGMVLGACILTLGMLVAIGDNYAAIIIGLGLISAGAFFTHSIAYGWVSRYAKQAKASATALYLMHYYVGGSLGGFYLLQCWQSYQWNGVVMGALILVMIIFYCVRELSHQRRRADVSSPCTN